MILNSISLIIGATGLIVAYIFYRKSLYYNKVSENKIVNVVEKKISELHDELKFAKPALQKISELAEIKDLPNLKKDVISSLKNIEDIENKLSSFSEFSRIVLFSKLYADDYKRDIEILRKFNHLPKDKLEEFKKILNETRLKVYMKSFPDLLKNLIIGLKIPDKPSSSNT